jgi:hypothetical protein
MYYHGSECNIAGELVTSFIK